MKVAVIAGFVGVGFALTAAQPARADLEITQKTVIDAPGVKQMLKEIPETQRAPLLKMVSPMMTGVPWVTTTYVQGSRTRTDMGDTTVVVNSESGKSFTLNRQTHAYSIGSYDPFQKSAGDIACHIAATDQTSRLFGHPVRKYAVSMTSSVLPKSTITGEIWAASDLPAPQSPGYLDGPAAGIEAEMAKIKGMPLAYKLVYQNTPAGDIKVESYPTEIKDGKLASSTFTIPEGFHKGETRMPTGTPSTGFPLGDGMPLDSMTAVTDDMATGGGESSGVASMLGGGSGVAGAGLGNMSAGDLQKLLGSLQRGAGGGGQDLAGMSPGDLQKMLGSLPGTGGGGGLGDMVNPQMLQLLSGMMQSMMDDDQ